MSNCEPAIYTIEDIALGKHLAQVYGPLDVVSPRTKELIDAYYASDLFAHEAWQHMFDDYAGMRELAPYAFYWSEYTHGTVMHHYRLPINLEERQNVYHSVLCSEMRMRVFYAACRSLVREMNDRLLMEGR